MLKDKIDHDESIIKEMKTTGADWTCHAHRVEDEWRPLLAQVNAKLINTIAGQKGVVTDIEVELSLQLGEEPYGQRGAPVQAPAVLCIRWVLLDRLEHCSVRQTTLKNTSGKDFC